MVVPALCALLCAKGPMLLAADAGTFEDSEAKCEPVKVLEDCCSPSINNMFLYKPSLCSYVGEIDVF